ncbi:hypothetical protein BK816_00490 [Boudabousia tangfeifanii]|uniref:Glycosyltransferase subfamily 4-like N-terminal domain-containing protein n=1 Tax=Boudabousia tangfeifanii TaxID=1912795 RepID=A0A1D9MI19_9ACTO|nr:glycosyltransferase family 4 protein [Boudabousia tangfeifanii]AOZ71955.1 hypothetical protein BK816_00490 [Boudabousia tangfeifanii]
MSAATMLATGSLKKRLLDEKKVIERGNISIPSQHTYIPRSDALFILTNSLPTTSSGYSHRSHALLKTARLSGLKVYGVTRLGYPVSIGRFSRKGFDNIDGITYFRSLPWKIPSLFSEKLKNQALFIVEIARDLKPALLHSTTDFQNGLVTCAAANALGIPWVYEMRGELENSWVARFPKEQQEIARHSERYLALRHVETSLAKKANAVIALSEVQKNSLVSRGVEEAKIFIVPNGVPESQLKQKRKRDFSRQHLGISPDLFVFGTISSIVDYEGLDILIKALLLLRKSKKHAYLAIVGDGVSLPQIIELACKHDVINYCFFPGRVSNQEADFWYQAIDVFCVPRKDTEVTRVVTPMKSIPALSYGVPVLYSDLPALAELVPKGHQDWLLPPNDETAWAAALGNLSESDYDRYDIDCKKLAASRTWEQGIKIYREIYKKLEGGEI